MEISDIINYLSEYDKDELLIMEVCGSHTSAIAKHGIKSLISDKIKLLSGPGCPVCVTPTAYIDRLIELSKKKDTYVVTFGDLLRVPGSKNSLLDERVNGAKSIMVYGVMDVINLAKENPDNQYVFAAIGFETTTPAYTLLLNRIIEEDISNIKILTALKTMPMAIDYICKNANRKMNGFIAPGHVAAVTGSNLFEPLAKQYEIPFAVAGFSAESLLAAIYGVVKKQGKGEVINCYRQVVNQNGSEQAKKLNETYFKVGDAYWRGMGVIKNSGLYLKDEFLMYDAGSRDLLYDEKKNKACRCDQVLVGNASPKDCPLFGKVCTPLSPEGACMVSEEGSCNTAYCNE